MINKEEDFRGANKDCHIPDDFSEVHRRYADLPEYLRRWCAYIEEFTIMEQNGTHVFELESDEDIRHMIDQLHKQTEGKIPREDLSRYAMDMKSLMKDAHDEMEKTYKKVMREAKTKYHPIVTATILMSMPVSGAKVFFKELEDEVCKKKLPMNTQAFAMYKNHYAGIAFGTRDNIRDTLEKYNDSIKLREVPCPICNKRHKVKSWKETHGVLKGKTIIENPYCSKKCEAKFEQAIKQHMMEEEDDS